MIKRILAGAAAAGFAASLFAAGPASADTCDSAAPSGDTVAGPAGPSGTTVYAGGDQNAGYVGVSGSTGYIGASGGAASQSGTIQGNGGNDAVYGKVTVSSTPDVCLNGKP